MLKTRTHINELETKIALDLVHRYLGIQQLVFSKWRHSYFYFSSSWYLYHCNNVNGSSDDDFLYHWLL